MCHLNFCSMQLMKANVKDIVATQGAFGALQAGKS